MQAALQSVAVNGSQWQSVRGERGGRASAAVQWWEEGTGGQWLWQRLARAATALSQSPALCIRVHLRAPQRRRRAAARRPPSTAALLPSSRAGALLSPLHSPLPFHSSHNPSSPCSAHRERRRRVAVCLCPSPSLTFPSRDVSIPCACSPECHRLPSQPQQSEDGGHRAHPQRGFVPALPRRDRVAQALPQVQAAAAAAPLQRMPTQKRPLRLPHSLHSMQCTEEGLPQVRPAQGTRRTVSAADDLNPLRPHRAFQAAVLTVCRARCMCSFADVGCVAPPPR